MQPPPPPPFFPPAGPPPPPFRPPHPPRRSNTALIVVLVVLFLVGGVAVAGAVVATQWDQIEEALESDDGYTPVPFTPPPPPPPYTPSEPEPVEPTPDGPKQENNGAGGPGVISTNGVLKRNDLYQAGRLKTQPCGAVSTVPLDSRQNLVAYAQNTLDCLGATWKPVKQLNYSGLTFDVFSPGDRINDENCQPSRDVRSFYCASSRAIYLYSEEIIPLWNSGAQQLARDKYTFTIAHEFGHHIQELNLIIPILNEGAYLGTGPDSRRLEHQANCWAGVFLHAQRDRYPSAAYEFGDASSSWRFYTDKAHGDGGNAKMWSIRGVQSGLPGTCNTWKAPASEVS